MSSGDSKNVPQRVTAESGLRQVASDDLERLAVCFKAVEVGFGQCETVGDIATMVTTYTHLLGTRRKLLGLPFGSAQVKNGNATPKFGAYDDEDAEDAIIVD